MKKEIILVMQWLKDVEPVLKNEDKELWRIFSNKYNKMLDEVKTKPMH